MATQADINAQYVDIFLPYLQPFMREAASGIAMAAIGFTECVSAFSCLYAHRTQRKKPLFIVTSISVVFSTISCLAFLDLLNVSLVDFQSIWPPGMPIDLLDPIPRAFGYRVFVATICSCLAFVAQQWSSCFAVATIFGKDGVLMILHASNALIGLAQLANTFVTFGWLADVGQIQFDNTVEGTTAKSTIAVLFASALICIVFNILFCYHLLSTMNFSRHIILEILTSRGTLRQLISVGLAILVLTQTVKSNFTMRPAFGGSFALWTAWQINSFIQFTFVETKDFVTIYSTGLQAATFAAAAKLRRSDSSLPMPSPSIQSSAKNIEIRGKLADVKRAHEQTLSKLFSKRSGSGKKPFAIILECDPSAKMRFVKLMVDGRNDSAIHVHDGAEVVISSSDVSNETGTDTSRSSHYHDAFQHFEVDGWQGSDKAMQRCVMAFFPNKLDSIAAARLASTPMRSPAAKHKFEGVPPHTEIVPPGCVSAEFWSDITKILAPAPTEYVFAKGIYPDGEAEPVAMTEVDAFCLSKTILFDVEDELVGATLTADGFCDALEEGRVKVLEGVHSPDEENQQILDRYLGPGNDVKPELFYKTTATGWYQSNDRAIWKRWICPISIPHASYAPSLTTLPTTYECTWDSEIKRRVFVLSPSFAPGHSMQTVLQFSAPQRSSPATDSRPVEVLQSHFASVFTWAWLKGAPVDKYPVDYKIPAIRRKDWDVAINGGELTVEDRTPLVPFLIRQAELYHGTRLACKREWDGSRSLLMFGEWKGDGNLVNPVRISRDSAGGGNWEKLAELSKEVIGHFKVR
ncbi:hypothetical protein HKX48_002684 [Thoreauomyces humboldtii]|nr:hypothetical protein HKX48_002684 [Thoreauomyces humboldtii]